MVIKLLLKLTLPMVELISYRDKINSQNIVESLKISCKEESSVGDDAMSLPFQKINCDDSTTNSRRLAINIRISPFTSNFSNKVQVIEDLINTFSKEHGYRIDFFIFETCRPWEKDLVKKIIEENKIKNYKIYQTEDPRIALAQMEGCDLALGISYHFIVFALKLGIPCIGIYSGEYYKSKMLGLLGWYKKSEWAVNIDNIKSNELINVSLRLIKNKNKSADGLIRVSEQLSISSSKAITKTLSLLN